MPERAKLFSVFFLLLWYAAMLAVTLTGFAHLPFAFRYGIIQAWRASPSVGHYWAAAAVMLLTGYALMIWLVEGRQEYRLTRWGKVSWALMAFLMLSGLAMILHNLPSFSIYGVGYAVIKLGHLFCAVLLPIVFVIRKISGGHKIVQRKQAVQRRSRQRCPQGSLEV